MKPSRIVAFGVMMILMGTAMLLITGGLITLLNKITSGWFDTLANWPQKGVFAVALVIAAFGTGLFLHVVLTSISIIAVSVARILPDNHDIPSRESSGSAYDKGVKESKHKLTVAAQNAIDRADSPATR